jgi:hypothetical protein
MSGMVGWGTGVPQSPIRTYKVIGRQAMERMSRHTTSEAEFRVMYDQCFDSIARYCLRRLPEHSAQDAVSDVFLTAWRRFDSIPPGDQSLLGSTVLPRTSFATSTVRVGVP